MNESRDDAWSHRELPNGARLSRGSGCLTHRKRLARIGGRACSAALIPLLVCALFIMSTALAPISVMAAPPAQSPATAAAQPAATTATIASAATTSAPAPCTWRMFSDQPPPSCANTASPGRAVASTSTLAPGFQESVVFSGLTNPTSVRFAPDGKVYVTEKSGLILVYSSLTATTPTVFADLSAEVDNYWDRGLMSIALDPNFPANPYVYVIYAYDAPIGGTAPKWNDACPTPPGPTTDGCVISGRISRLTVDSTGNAIVPGSEKVLVNAWCQQFPSHSTDDLEFGPDGALYASAGEGSNFNATDWGQYGSTYSGDQANPCGDPPAGVGGKQTPPTAEGGALRAQSLQRPAGEPAVLNGSIIRIDPATGAALPTNPLYSSSDPNARRIVGYGLRNPFRFTFRPGTNEIWIGDVGWSTWEEIDRLTNPTATPIENFGWPCYEGVAPQPSYQSAGLNICTHLYNTAGSVTAPVYTYNHSAKVVPGESCPTGSSSISGMAFYQGANYPTAYHGALFFADYSRNCIWAMAEGGNGLPDPTKITTVVAGAGSPVDLEVGPAGDIFYADLNDGQIRRIQAIPPHAVAVATSPTTGQPPLTVSFDGSQSTDSDPKATLSYSWDLNGDGTFGDSTSITPSFTYTAIGRYSVRLKITDSRGLTSISDPLTIMVGTPPKPTITAPSSSLTWKVGDTINFSGSAVDAQGNTLPASALDWTIILHHCPSNCHTHLVQTFTGVASGSFAAPDHEYPSYLEIQLTATDSHGLQATTSVSIQPQTVALTFQSSPPGLTLAVGSATGTTPFTRTVIVGSSNSVSAPSPQSIGSAMYTFASWSDGGAQNHTVVAGSSPATYSASYKTVPVETGKTTLSDTSIDGPALWTAGRQPSAGAPVAVLAWAGSDTAHHLNVMLSEDGHSYGSKLTLPETSFARPSVLVVNSTIVVLAWSGTDPRHSLNVLYDVYGSRSKLTLRDTSGYAPSLTFYNGQIWLAWAGTDGNHSLNVMPLGPRGLTPGTKVVLSQYSAGSPPALVADAAAHQLALTWTQKAAPLQITLAVSSDGVHWSTPPGEPSAQTSVAGPTLLSTAPAPENGYVYYWAWTGTGRTPSLYILYSDALSAWPAPVLLPESTHGGPALGYPGPGGTLLLAWTGTDLAHHLNIATLAD